MDIQDLVPRGESFYQTRMIGLIEELESMGLLQFDDGRKIFWAPASDVPLIMVKSDGGFTYDTSDLTAIRQRIQEEGAERIVYVVDSGQVRSLSVYYRLFALAEPLGFSLPGSLLYPLLAKSHLLCRSLPQNSFLNPPTPSPPPRPQS